MEKAAQEESEKRIRSAPSGDHLPPRSTDVPHPEDYGFGPISAKALGGEVVVYRPREDGGRLVVPLKIENQGTKRKAYKVTITVKGKGIRSSVATVEAGNVFPGTTWPTQADITTVGAIHLDDVSVAVEATRKELW